jgi:hypothetical protein
MGENLESGVFVQPEFRGICHEQMKSSERPYFINGKENLRTIVMREVIMYIRQLFWNNRLCKSPDP